LRGVRCARICRTDANAVVVGMRIGAFPRRNGTVPSPNTPAIVESNGKQHGDAAAEITAPAAPSLSKVNHDPPEPAGFTTFCVLFTTVTPICLKRSDLTNKQLVHESARSADPENDRAKEQSLQNSETCRMVNARCQKKRTASREC